MPTQTLKEEYILKSILGSFTIYYMSGWSEQKNDPSCRLAY